MLTEFRDFIARGNVLDLAVAVIIGAAFATIAASLTEDIIMPIVGAIYLKTDGQRLITAFKKEDKSDKDKWFYFEYRIIDGKLVLVPR